MWWGEVEDPGVQSGNVVGEVEWDPGVQSGNVVGEVDGSGCTEWEWVG